MLTRKLNELGNAHNNSIKETVIRKKETKDLAKIGQEKRMKASNELSKSQANFKPKNLLAKTIR